MKNLEQLREDLKSNEELRNKILACKDEAAANATLAEAGYDVTLADTVAYAKEQKTKLTDEQLSSVAGGFWVDSPGWETNVPSGIACCVVGAGATCWMSFGREEDD